MELRLRIHFVASDGVWFASLLHWWVLIMTCGRTEHLWLEACLRAGPQCLWSNLRASLAGLWQPLAAFASSQPARLHARAKKYRRYFGVASRRAPIEPSAVNISASFDVARCMQLLHFSPARPRAISVRARTRASAALPGNHHLRRSRRILSAKKRWPSGQRWPWAFWHAWPRLSPPP